MEKKVLVGPSLLSSRWHLMEHFKEDVESVEKEADYYHVDVMDGKFVPTPNALNASHAQAITDVSKKPVCVHLMTFNPSELFNDFAKAGSDSITVHAEAYSNEQELLQDLDKLTSLKVKTGVSVKPNTPQTAISDNVLKKLDRVLVMTVEPGQGGQEFISKMLDKISELKKRIDSLNLKTLIQVDGGINPHTAKQCVERGVTLLIAGSSVFKSQDRLKTIREIRGNSN
ncbi:MAG: ribulose-phosphate 3-epimerase [Candidatus Micrarchaeia archaeon]